MTTHERWSPAFEADTDYVGTQTAYVRTARAQMPVGGAPGHITLTTTTPHYFQTNAWVMVSGVGELFDGTYPISSLPDGQTIQYEYFVDLEIATFTLGVLGIVTSPAVSYVRWGQDAPAVDNVAGRTTLHTEPWDYNTVRVVWGIDNATALRASRDLALGYEPRIVITRSCFGYPSTPWDGDQVLNRSFMELQATHYFETQQANFGNDWNRPPMSTQGLYDRNLQSGKWYYYTAFYWLGEYDTIGSLIRQAWAKGASQDALTPVNHHHSERLYELIPEHYRVKDQEYIAGTGRTGVVERLLRIVGIELDYTRTLSDGIEHVYDVDTTHDDLLRSLGLQNFGVKEESGLGSIRYRSLLATITRLYEERGSAVGVKKMVDAASKYRSKVVEGLNMMSLTDDAEFASGTGSWGNPYPHYEKWMDTHAPWMTGVDTFNFATFRSVSLMTSPEGGPGTSLVPRRNAMIVDPVETDPEFGLLITCGLGVGTTDGRRHEPVDVDFFPRFHGILCDTDVEYTFSAYTALAEEPTGRAAFDDDDFFFDDATINFDGGGPIPGKMAIGILWFADPENGVFDVDRDFLQRDEADPVTESYGVGYPFRRVVVNATSPFGKWGRKHVYAVPYLLFEDGVHARYVSACMFHTDRREFVVAAI